MGGPDRPRDRNRGDHTDAREGRSAVKKQLRCEDVLDQLWEYLDDEARAELTAQINEHLSHCSDCRVEVDSLRKTVSLYRCHETVVMPIALSGSLREALDQAYGETPGSSD